MHAHFALVRLMKRQVSGVCINRPCRDERLWKALFDCLAVGNGVFFWPGLEGLIVNRSEVAEDIPQAMIDSVGAVSIVRDYHALVQMLNKG